MRRARKDSLPNVPDTLLELANLFENGQLDRYKANSVLIYKGITLKR